MLGELLKVIIICVCVFLHVAGIIEGKDVVVYLYNVWYIWSTGCIFTSYGYLVLFQPLYTIASRIIYANAYSYISIIYHTVTFLLTLTSHSVHFQTMTVYKYMYTV